MHLHQTETVRDLVISYSQLDPINSANIKLHSCRFSARFKNWKRSIAGEGHVSPSANKSPDMIPVHGPIKCSLPVHNLRAYLQRTGTYWSWQELIFFRDIR